MPTKQPAQRESRNGGLTLCSIREAQARHPLASITQASPFHISTPEYQKLINAIISAAPTYATCDSVIGTGVASGIYNSKLQHRRTKRGFVNAWDREFFSHAQHANPKALSLCFLCKRKVRWSTKGSQLPPVK